MMPVQACGEYASIDLDDSKQTTFKIYVFLIINNSHIDDASIFIDENSHS
jgi:hypothetical protein